MTNHMTDLTQKVQAAMTAQPELAKQMNECTSKADLAALLSKALSTTVTVNDLDTLEQHREADMTDAQLDSIAAGIFSRRDDMYTFKKSHPNCGDGNH